MIPDILTEAELKMDAAVEHAKEDFAAIRTGRAHPAMFAKLTADYYGAQTPLQQLASFQVPDARMVLISPYDKSSMTAIEKSIRDSDLGIGSITRLARQLERDHPRDVSLKRQYLQVEHQLRVIRIGGGHAGGTIEIW